MGFPWLTVLTKLWECLLPDVAGVVSLAVAEVASLADFAGVVSSADLAGMAFSGIAAVASPAKLAVMAFPAVVGVTSIVIIVTKPSHSEP